MTTEDKKLLLKDLCARLPYRVKCEVIKCRIDGEMVYIRSGSSALGLTINNVKELVTDNLYEIKPYLFPLESMTEEQRNEYEDALVYHDYVNGAWTMAKTFDDEYAVPYWFVDFCNKNHLDYRGLIPMGLAIDATGKNIY